MNVASDVNVGFKWLNKKKKKKANITHEFSLTEAIGHQRQEQHNYLGKAEVQWQQRCRWQCKGWGINYQERQGC